MRPSASTLMQHFTIFMRNFERFGFFSESEPTQVKIFLFLSDLIAHATVFLQHHFCSLRDHFYSKNCFHFKLADYSPKKNLQTLYTWSKFREKYDNSSVRFSTAFDKEANRKFLFVISNEMQCLWKQIPCFRWFFFLQFGSI